MIKLQLCYGGNWIERSDEYCCGHGHRLGILISGCQMKTHLKWFHSMVVE